MWPPIHRQMEELCGDLLSKDLLRQMEFNEGAGPKGHDVCSKMASRIEKALPDDPGGIWLDSHSTRVTSDGRLVGLRELQEDPHLVTQSPFRASRTLLLDWIGFLRHCGGFEVW
jgi:hypothetical protein